MQIRMQQQMQIYASQSHPHGSDRVRNLHAMRSELKSRTALHPEPMTNIKVMNFEGRKKKDLTNQTNDWLDLKVIV
jgi:hypothetical protein